jgi:hypothetical protein
MGELAVDVPETAKSSEKWIQISGPERASIARDMVAILHDFRSVSARSRAYRRIGS